MSGSARTSWFAQVSRKACKRAPVLASFLAKTTTLLRLFHPLDLVHADSVRLPSFACTSRTSTHSLDMRACWCSSELGAREPGRGEAERADAAQRGAGHGAHLRLDLQHAAAQRAQSEALAPGRTSGPPMASVMQPALARELMHVRSFGIRIDDMLKYGSDLAFCLEDGLDRWGGGGGVRLSTGAAHGNSGSEV